MADLHKWKHAKRSVFLSAYVFLGLFFALTKIEIVFLGHSHPADHRLFNGFGRFRPE